MSAMGRKQTSASDRLGWKADIDRATQAEDNSSVR